MAHELALPKDRISISVLFTEHAGCSRPTQHRTQRWLRGVKEGNAQVRQAVTCLAGEQEYL